MTLTELMYFNEVAQTKNFTAAAANLYISQPSLSYSIQQLERELDVPLFIRHKNRQVELTLYGEALLPHARAALKNISSGRDAVKELISPLSGTVRIEFFWSIATTLVPTLLKKYTDDNPEADIKFQFTVDHVWADLEKSLTEDRTDLVISAGNLNGECASSCIAYQRLMVYLPSSHPLAAQNSVTLEEIRGEQISVFSPNSNMDRTIKKVFRSNGIKPDFTYASDWCSQLLQVSVNGNIGLNIDHAVTTPLVKKVPLADENSLLQIYVSWPVNRKMSVSSTFVRDYLIELARKTPAKWRTF